MDDTAALIQRLYDEASQCELFGITKPAALLREAAEALQHAANLQAMSEFAEVVTAGHLSDAEPVAWGFPNSAITGGSRWLMLREQVPADDQYGGAMWVPLYAEPQAAAEIERLRVELADAKHAMRAYAKENPRHEYQGRTQDPNGVHAWLARNDKA